MELIKSKSDNEVKGASVKVPRTGGTVQQPTNKLIPIECTESHLQNNNLDRLRSVVVPLPLSRRNAAIVGKLRRWFDRNQSNRALARECFIYKNN